MSPDLQAEVNNNETESSRLKGYCSTIRTQLWSVIFRLCDINSIAWDILVSWRDNKALSWGFYGKICV